MAEEEEEIAVETIIFANAVDRIADGLFAIAKSINRLADAQSGDEVTPDEHVTEYLSGKTVG